MKTIVLCGDPNVGKSVLFSRLTGVDVIASNYPGTTVDYAKGRLRLPDTTATIIDAPGMYSLSPTNKAEEVGRSLLQQADVIVNVVDATSLERSLFLTVELLQLRKPMIIALNLWDEAQHLGIQINVAELERLLQVPVVPTVAITGEGIKELVQRLEEARAPEPAPQPQLQDSDEKTWTAVGHLVSKVQVVAHRHHTLKDLLVDATVKSGTGWLMALVILAALFGLVRLVGEGLIGYVIEPLFELYRTPIAALSSWLEPGLLRDVLIGKLIGGQVDYEQSMGVITTGLFVPFGMVLPYIIAFYLALALLEDSGYLPRLATVTDNVFHKFGLHGHSIIPVLLGLGCNVPGVLSARNMETRKQRFLAATLVSITVPCMAQSAMIFGVLGHYGIRYIFLVYGILFSIFLILGAIMNKTVPGDCPELFLDIPPYRRPSLMIMLKKTWMRVRWFLAEAVPFLFLGVLVVALLNAFGAIDYLARYLTPFMQGWFGLPGAAAPALLAGFLRKDLAVGMLVPLALSPAQLTIAVTVLTLFFPCVATFPVLFKELGFRDMLKALGLMVLTALLAGGLLRILMRV
ncbi:MAG: ferrous iron transporter B [Lentisphaerae bacterium]|nr:ferrous iron transporter B [Lentisphaerota bacterium]